jgi:uncharacterized membrane protein
MTLTPTGESRVNGYLFVLERSLKTFLPADVVRDAVREIESHLRERIAAVDGGPDERAALERILAELGPPLRVAQAYSTERTIEEAVTTGRFVPILRAIWHLAATTVLGFFAGLAVFLGYLISFLCFLVALLKPFFPQNVGVQFVRGIPVGFAAQFPVAPGVDIRGGYWVIPAAAFTGLVLFVLTHRGARWYLTWWRRHRES